MTGRKITWCGRRIGRRELNLKIFRGYSASRSGRPGSFVQGLLQAATKARQAERLRTRFERCNKMSAG